MFRYLAMLWDSRNVRASACVRDIEQHFAKDAAWNVAFSDGTIRLWCSRAQKDLQAAPISRPHGAIVGSVFSAPDIHDLSRDLVPTPTMVDAWLADSARMMRDSWGNYVAFHCAPCTRRVRIVKDPTGSLPCLHVLREEVHIIFSCLSDVLDLKLGTIKVNRDYLQRRLAGLQEPVRCDALAGVTALVGGESIEFDLNTSPVSLTRRQYWQPAIFSEPDQKLEDPTAARHTVRATALACTRAWASQHRRILHRLSGGLDSSVVLGCLSRAGAPRVSCYTYFDPQGRSDERSWARAAAAHAHYVCLEHPFIPESVPLPQIASFRPTLEPVSTLTYLQRASLERGLCLQYEASAVFTGLGGDSGFCRDSIGLAVLDYLRLQGLRMQAVALSAAVARHTDLSFWQVLAAALWHRWSGTQPSEMSGAYTRMSQLIHPQVRGAPSPAAERHPWLDGSRALPSLRRRLGSLLLPAEYYDVSISPAAEAPAIISPLLSQPMVEVCLRIPTYLHFERGIERGLARHAFSQEVPAIILQRRWKDRAPGFFDRVLAAQRPFVRDFLLEGVLVREQWLSRPALEAALSDQVSRNQVSTIEILNHLDTEAWLRHWQ